MGIPAHSSAEISDAPDRCVSFSNNCIPIVFIQFFSESLIAEMFFEIGYLGSLFRIS
jgi:hypothetical protein